PRRAAPLANGASGPTRRCGGARGSTGMTAHAEPLHGGHHDDQHGPPPANQSTRLDPRTLGMLLFIGSEIMLFGSFFAVNFFVRVVNPSAPDHWPPEPFHFPV